MKDKVFLMICSLLALLALAVAWSSTSARAAPVDIAGIGLAPQSVAKPISQSPGQSVAQQATTPPCPDTTNPVVTATATALATSGPVPTGTVTPRPTVLVSSGLFNVTQPAVFDIIHTLVEYGPGVSSPFLRYPEPVNFIVLEGEITLCSGSFQRVIGTSQSWTFPADTAFILANNGSAVSRLSLVRVAPQQTATPPPAGTLTEAPTATPSVAPSATPSETVMPTEAGTSTQSAGPAFLGIRVVAEDDTGLRIAEIFANSPAAAAQLAVDDVIVALDGAPLASLLGNATPDPNSTGATLVAAFFNTIAARQPGSQITLSIQRGGQPMDVVVTLGAQAP